MTFQVRNLTRNTPEDRRPFWTADLVAGSERLHVHTRHGSWCAEVNGRLRHLLPDVARRLQEKVRPLERKEVRP